MSENNSNNKPNFFKSFFVSLGSDIKHLITKRWMKLIGLVIMYVVPLIVLLVYFGKSQPTHFALTIVGWLFLIILIVMYWNAFRRFLASKLASMKEQNKTTAGKHIALILIAQVLQVIMSILPFILVAWVFYALKDTITDIKFMFVIMGVCMGLGGMFIIGDTILNLNR